MWGGLCLSLDLDKNLKHENLKHSLAVFNARPGFSSAEYIVYRIASDSNMMQLFSEVPFSPLGFHTVLPRTPQVSVPLSKHRPIFFVLEMKLGSSARGEMSYYY